MGIGVDIGEYWKVVRPILAYFGLFEDLFRLISFMWRLISAYLEACFGLFRLISTYLEAYFGLFELTESAFRDTPVDPGKFIALCL